MSRVSQNCTVAAAGVLAFIAVSANALDNEADELAVLESPEYSAAEQAHLAADAAVASHRPSGADVWHRRD